MLQDNLIQELPADLEDAFRRTSLPGEIVLVSLPSALGEALVVTDRRIAILREKESQDGIDVFSHQLSTVRSASIDFSQTGGMLKLEIIGPAEDDQQTAYFPVDRHTYFAAAAERITELISSAAAQAEGSAPVEPSRGVCPSCGVPIGDGDAFCARCGQKIRDVCQLCGSVVPPMAGFCPHCGSETRPAAIACPACGARANSAVMSYCPQCGTSLLPRCAACGGSTVPGWPRCRYCGREIGSSQGPAGRGFRLHRDRMLEEQAERPSEAEPADEVADNPAAGHNASGATLFDQEKVEEAIEEFRRAVMLDPDNGSYHCNLAVAYDEADQDDDARREYERALELNPNDTTALLYLGYLLNEKDEHERAAELWRRLAQLAPGTPDAEEAEQNLRAQEAL
jgi:uncharacterized OB-fold protein